MIFTNSHPMDQGTIDPKVIRYFEWLSRNELEGIGDCLLVYVSIMHDRLWDDDISDLMERLGMSEEHVIEILEFLVGEYLLIQRDLVETQEEAEALMDEDFRNLRTLMNKINEEMS